MAVTPNHDIVTKLNLSAGTQKTIPYEAYIPKPIVPALELRPFLRFAACSLVACYGDYVCRGLIVLAPGLVVVVFLPQPVVVYQPVALVVFAAAAGWASPVGFAFVAGFAFDPG